MSSAKDYRIIIFRAKVKKFKIVHILLNCCNTVNFKHRELVKLPKFIKKIVVKTGGCNLRKKSYIPQAHI